MKQILLECIVTNIEMSTLYYFLQKTDETEKGVLRALVLTIDAMRIVSPVTFYYKEKHVT